MERNRAALAGQVARIRADGPLAAEIRRIIASPAKPEWLPEAQAGLEAVRWHSDDVRGVVAPGVGELEEETIVLRMGRPVVSIVGGQAKLEFADAGSETWKARLEECRRRLAPVIGSIGRVEVSNHPSGLDYMGTGWLVDDGVIATNRHVALAFAARGTGGFTFLTGFDRRRPIGVDIDFLEEFGNTKQDPVRIASVLYIAKDAEPDVAFLRLDPRAPARAAKPMVLASSLIPADAMVAVIGYPARDNRVPDALLMDRIFGKVYDKKRLAPGFTTGFERGSVRHDCTTLGGNSGSPLIDLSTAEVCGLHYSGAFLQGNYAVPSVVVKKMLADIRGAGGPLVVVPPGGAHVDAVDPSTSSTETELRVTVPIEITIRLGATQLAPTAGAPTVAVAAPVAATSTPVATAAPADQATLDAAVNEARRLYGQRPDVFNIEAGWKFTDGWITDVRAVVFSVRSKLSSETLTAQGIVSLPRTINGVPVDVRVARLDEVHPDVALEATAWTSTYERLANESTLLAEVDEEMSVVLHASPDAGWPVLSEFLAGTKKRLTVGMYDFTAPHVIDGVSNAAAGATGPFRLVLQHGESLSTGTKKDDIPEEESIDRFRGELDTRFDQAWAVTTGSSSPFKSAYHIKVAVRDGTAYWLSSGNWQSSNQPAIDPLHDGDARPALLSSHNREWHVVVKNKRLAKSFETYLRHDLDQAKAAADEAVLAPETMVWVPAGYYQPSGVELEARPQYTAPLRLKKRLRAQPLLTPDNYSGHVVDLIDSATDRVYFQNQSLSILDDNPEHYESLLGALVEKHRAGLDVRVIIRKFGELPAAVSKLKDRGFDTVNKMRLQTNCHTKGIVVDGKAVLLGSHNWTGDGTGFNRDASMIFFDEEVAGYYEQLFLYDWGRVGPPRIDESLPTPELADPGDPTPRPGMVLIPLKDWLGET